MQQYSGAVTLPFPASTVVFLKSFCTPGKLLAINYKRGNRISCIYAKKEASDPFLDKELTEAAKNMGKRSKHGA